MSETDAPSKPGKINQHHWLIYIAAVLASLLLIADAANFGVATKITARLGIGMLYTAFAFIVAGSRPSTYIGTILLWVAIALAILL